MNSILRASLYIGRYAPSQKRITTYLERKGVTDIAGTLGAVWYDELMMLQVWMNTYTSQFFPIAKIRNKLMRKDFPKDSIELLIEEMRPQWADWECYQEAILSEWKRMQGSGKSRRFILQKLVWNYPHFRSEIQEYFSDFTDLDALDYTAKKYAHRCDFSDPKQTHRFIARLARKWFHIANIRKWIDTFTSS